MLRYALKRLLLLPPTFFLVSMVIFTVLNLAPQSPGDGGAGQEQGAGGAATESLRVFREQFHLDKPVLLNLRRFTSGDDVRAWLLAEDDPAAPPAERLRARATLDDHGNDLVGPLVALLADPDPAVRAAALARLPQAAKRPYARDRAGTADEVRAMNREISVHNAALPLADPVAWTTWWAAHEAEYAPPGAAAVASSVLLDTRFAMYWSNLLHLDFGRSVVDRQPVLPTIASKLRYSLSLGFASIVLAYFVAVPIGIFSAVKRGTTADTIVTIALFVLYSLPTFFTGTVLLRLLSEGDPVAWFPTGGFEAADPATRTVLARLADIAWHLVLPVATYTSVTLAALSRYARAGVIDVIRADYVRTARAKGLSELVVVLRHAARNGMIPILTLLGGLLPMLVGGSVVIEVVFGIPGMGQYLYESINTRDYNAVMGVLLASSLLTLVGLFVSDVSYALADPRITFD